MSTPEEFLVKGQTAMTVFAQAAQQLKDWSSVYVQRGGVGAFGNDANNLHAFVSVPLAAWIVETANVEETIAAQRTDY